mgnify:CR=1 FL=1
MEKEILYRPEIAKQMRNILNSAVTLYSANLYVIYYDFLARSYILTKENANDFVNKDFIEKYADSNTKAGKYALFLKEISETLNSPSGYDIFIEEYEEKLNKEYNIETITEASAARFVFEIFEKQFLYFKEKMINEAKKPLTTMEQFEVDLFFKEITAPMRNPNIQIPQDKTKCWYDRYPHNNYRSDLNQHVEWIKEHANNIIEIFDTPDKEVEYEEVELE